MNPRPCGAVFVAEFGERPDLDRLQQCQRVDCLDHQRQLAWVHADVARFLSYAQQLRRFTIGDRAKVEEMSLL